MKPKSNLVKKNCGFTVHPNDDVNKSQSTNDTFPSAIQISVVTEIINKLVPSIKEMTKVTLKRKILGHPK